MSEGTPAKPRLTVFQRELTEKERQHVLNVCANGIWEYLKGHGLATTFKYYPVKTSRRFSSEGEEDEDSEREDDDSEEDDEIEEPDDHEEYIAVARTSQSPKPCNEGSQVDFFEETEYPPTVDRTTLLRRFLPTLDFISENLKLLSRRADFPGEGERNTFYMPSGSAWVLEGHKVVYVLPTKQQELAEWLVNLTYSAVRAGPRPRPDAPTIPIYYPVSDILR